jgi:hypothetical protein
MPTVKQRTAKPKVNQYRTVSVEADLLSRQLQEKIGCSANQLAERAIYALAEEQERRREQPALNEQTAARPRAGAPLCAGRVGRQCR